MEIIKSKLFQPRKCEFGDFELKPEKGWKLSQTFIDYESGLLIVSVNDEDENNWEVLGYNGKRIPTKQFVIDLKSLTILTPNQWSKYFNYENVTITTSDNKFKLTTKRIHEPENNTDSIYEELEFLETNQKSTSTSIAFRKEKRENLLEAHLTQIEEIKKTKEEFEKKPNLTEFHQIKLKELKPKSKIIFFCDNNYTYNLLFDGNVFNLLKSKVTPNTFNPNNLSFEKFNEFKTLESFMDWFFVDKWFVKYKMIDRDDFKSFHLLTKPITDKLNELRKSHKFTQEENYSINSWQNYFWTKEIKETEYKQFCPICFEETSFQPRYPKYICRECNTDRKKSFEGEKVSFSNLGFSGGLRVSFYDDLGNLLKEQDEHLIYEFKLDNYLCTAEEARFGGIVIQLKE
ncbi:MAG TPA: hypothetical protein VLZ83_17040 [Edaphocola sp.]|nr:hypothetical protein [Edaphocola sp.]